MSDKLEKLTKQVYDEGIAKAQEEAKKIGEKAEEEKRKTLRSARQEADDIIAVAKKEAEELKHGVESEVRMASAQALATLRQNINELICDNVAADATKGLFDDTEFLKNILEIVMKEWLGTHCQREQDFYLKLPQELQVKIQDHFLKKGRQELGKGLKIKFDDKIKSGFVITPSDGSYRIGFTEEDFKALIIYFLRPRMKKFLFGTEEKKK